MTVLGFISFSLIAFFNSFKWVHKNKITMLGWVMGCLEQVFVHDGLGRPTYFETYSGRAPWGEYVLSLFEKIEKRLENPAPPLQVIRLLVLDGANNSVKTLRAFAAQNKYNFVTTLDKNQWQPRRIRREDPKRRYEYGDAFEQTEERRQVYLKRNRQDKATMALLEQVLPKLNQLNLRHSSGRRLEFVLS